MRKILYLNIQNMRQARRRELLNSEGVKQARLKWYQRREFRMRYPVTSIILDRR